MCSLIESSFHGNGSLLKIYKEEADVLDLDCPLVYLPGSAENVPRITNPIGYMPNSYC
jgi:hypothetical protein